MNMKEPLVVLDSHTREQLLTVQEYATLVRAHPLSIYRMIREKRLKGVVRVGSHIRINASIALDYKPSSPKYKKV